MASDLAGPLTRRADVPMEVMPDGSALLYDPLTDQGHVLTPLGALVWDMCDGTMSADQLVAEVTAALPDVPDLIPTVTALIDEFARLDLLAGSAVI